MKITRKILAIILFLATVLSVSACSYGAVTTGKNDEVVVLPSDSGLTFSPAEAEDINDEVSPTVDELNKRDEVLTLLDNDYESRTHTSYDNINGKTVDLYTFYRASSESQNNPNFSQILMVKQCIDYKDKHPDEEVKISICSFHFSVYLAACLDAEKAEYGNLKNLVDKEYDESTGYYRLSYLLVEAAKKGIYVTVVGQLDAAGVYIADGVIKADGNFEYYYVSKLGEKAYIDGKTVGDFLSVRRTYWTSYGDKAAADMMHLKSCTVSNYIDNSGKEHGVAVWLGSTNLDGVDYRGFNGNNGIQTGIIITEHDELYRVINNYVDMMLDYCEQEEINFFRNIVIDLNTEQIALIKAGREDEIDKDKQIVYLGSESDKVFEFYFAPFGGDTNVWNTDTNPFCKFLDKILPNNADKGERIELLWNNVKFVYSFNLADTMLEVIRTAFYESGSLDNVLRLRLPEVDPTLFSELKVGENIGHLYVGAEGLYHTKDLQLSYSEGGTRYYVTLYNTLNMHEGSMCYQTNTVLVVKETAETGNNFYIDYAILTSPGIEFESKRVEKGN